MKKHHQTQPSHSTDHSTDQTSDHGHRGSHFDELAQIERLRAAQRVLVRQQYAAAHPTDRPAAQPYLRRASHRR